MQEQFVGSWKIQVSSPLGVDYYTLAISSSLNVMLSEARGSMQFHDVQFVLNTFELIGKTETPTKSTIVMNGKLENGIIFGTIKINEYSVVDFKGLKNE